MKIKEKIFNFWSFTVVVIYCQLRNLRCGPNGEPLIKHEVWHGGEIVVKKDTILLLKFSLLTESSRYGHSHRVSYYFGPDNWPQYSWLSQPSGWAHDVHVHYAKVTIFMGWALAFKMAYTIFMTLTGFSQYQQHVSRPSGGPSWALGL